MAAPGKSRFSLSEMGEADRHNLSTTFLASIERFYDDPANRERFERWQEQQKSRVSAVKS